MYGGIAPLIPNLGTRQRRTVDFYVPVTLYSRKNPGTDRTEGWVGYSASLDEVEKRKIQHCQESYPSCLAHSLVTLLTELPSNPTQRAHKLVLCDTSPWITRMSTTGQTSPQPKHLRGRPTHEWVFPTFPSFKLYLPSMGVVRSGLHGILARPVDSHQTGLDVLLRDPRNCGNVHLCNESSQSLQSNQHVRKQVNQPFTKANCFKVQKFSEV